MWWQTLDWKLVLAVLGPFVALVAVCGCIAAVPRICTLIERVSERWARVFDVWTPQDSDEDA